MGDITGRPKAPSQQVVYVPQYVYQNTPSTGTETNNNAGDPATLTPEQQREKNLLSRAQPHGNNPDRIPRNPFTKRNARPA